MNKAESTLRQRIARLDRGPGDLELALHHFIQVLGQTTDSGDHSTTGIVSAEVADSIVGQSTFLRDLNTVVPEVVAGPLALDQQFWTSTGKPEYLLPQHPEPMESLFVTAEQAQITSPSTKPFGVGIFTATRILSTDMWRMYLDLHKGSTLHLSPWQTWKMSPLDAVRVMEIASASDWVVFNQTYPHKAGAGSIYPDWARASADYDAVHITLRAIAAIQGLRMTSDVGLIAPAYWDIESTLWLRWRFRPASAVLN